MEANDLKYLILVPFIVILFLYFAKHDNFETLMGAIIIAAIAYFVTIIKRKDVIGQGE